MQFSCLLLLLLNSFLPVENQKRSVIPDLNLSSQVACAKSFSRCVGTGISPYMKFGLMWALGCICIFSVSSFISFKVLDHFREW